MHVGSVIVEYPMSILPRLNLTANVVVIFTHQGTRKHALEQNLLSLPAAAKSDVMIRNKPLGIDQYLC